MDLIFAAATFMAFHYGILAPKATTLLYGLGAVSCSALIVLSFVLPGVTSSEAMASMFIGGMFAALAHGDAVRRGKRRVIDEAATNQSASSTVAA